MKRFFNAVFPKEVPTVSKEEAPAFFPYGSGDIPLKYKLNSRAKRLTLRMSVKDKSLVLTIPPKTKEFEIQAFLKRCIPWVEKQVSKPAQTLTFSPGNEVNLHGVAFTC